MTGDDGVDADVWVVRTGALGDFVATIPVLDRLRERPGRLVVVSSLRYRALFPAADAWIDAEGQAAAALFAGRTDLREAVGVAWTAGAAAALRACGARQVREGTPHPPPGRSIHDHLWASALDGPRDRDPRLHPAATALEAMRERLGGERPVIVAPGSGGARKRWPLERWRRVAEAMARPVLWIGGPLEVGEPGWGEPRWDDLGLPELMALARECAAWIGPDAGPSHLATAAGAPTGVVFVGATDPRCWAPPGAQVFGPEADVGDVVAWARAASESRGWSSRL